VEILEINEEQLKPLPDALVVRIDEKGITVIIL